MRVPGSSRANAFYAQEAGQMVSGMQGPETGVLRVVSGNIYGF